MCDGRRRNDFPTLAAVTVSGSLTFEALDDCNVVTQTDVAMRMLFAKSDLGLSMSCTEVLIFHPRAFVLVVCVIGVLVRIVLTGNHMY